ncbi:uncharacterized protein BX664DRAFT_324240 [Halteromyces radiatus]|uniref:uncharacterized protein n=1 Tax=Halteromyces radiatus TaxID=101107 RepID=UPI00221FC951|nr:uncharacterized protein BX664DRAFT_324240 [Halteromyces radiatus]KAI8096548.1 hypothetical protein BX664DRAFT_324240 [Halteromyces radiatus]
MQRSLSQSICLCSRLNIIRCKPTFISSYSTASVFRPPPSKLHMNNKNKSSISNGSRLAAVKDLFQVTTDVKSSKPTIPSATTSTKGKPAAVGTGRSRRDEEITSRWITFVDQEGQVHQRQRLESTLQSFDRQLYFLVEVDPTAKPPVCRLFEKKHLFDKQKANKKKKTVSSEQITKEIVFGWNVSLHDMGHKLGKAIQFLDKGNKVKIEIVYKKGQKRVDKETQQQVIAQVQQQLNAYKLAKPPTLSGANCMMQFEQKK